MRGGSPTDSLRRPVMKISELLCDESKWCKEHNAENAQGNQVYFESPDAVKWCLGVLF